MSFALADLISAILSWILVYGAVVLFAAVLLAAIGFPLPSTFLILAAGAFVHQEVLDLPTALGFALVGVIIGDCLSYGLGYMARGAIVRHFGDNGTWQRAEEYLRRRGAVAIFLTRWLLTTLALPTNLAAGSGGYPFPRFLLIGTAGELLWLLIYGSLGYAFSDRWEMISALVTNFGGVLVGVLLLVGGVVLVIRHRRNQGKDAGK